MLFELERDLFQFFIELYYYYYCVLSRCNRYMHTRGSSASAPAGIHLNACARLRVCVNLKSLECKSFFNSLGAHILSCRSFFFFPHFSIFLFCFWNKRYHDEIHPRTCTPYFTVLCTRGCIILHPFRFWIIRVLERQQYVEKRIKGNIDSFKLNPLVIRSPIVRLFD